MNVLRPTIVLVLVVFVPGILCLTALLLVRLKRATERLRVSEEKYRTLVEEAPDAIFISDTNLRFTDLNTRASELSGFTRDEILRMSITDLMPTGNLAAAPLKIGELQSGKTVVTERRFKRKDGTIVPVEVSSKTLNDGRLQAIVRDISERRLAERKRGELFAHEQAARAEAEAAKAEVTRVLESVSDAFVSLDNNWRYVSVNDKAAQIFGRTCEDMIGKHIWTEFPEGVGQPFYHAYYRALDEQIFIEIEEYYAPYDRWFENRIYPSPDGLSIFFHEITARKQAEAEVRLLAQRLTLATDAASIGIWDWDLKADLWYASPTYFRMLGYDPDEFSDWHVWFKRLHPEDQAAVGEKNRAMLAGSVAPYEYEARMLHADGSYRWIHVIGRVLALDEQGKASRLTGVRMDITERKQGEAALRESEARTQLLVKSFNLGLWDWNLLTNEVFFSPEWKQQLGHADHDLPNRYEEWESRLHPEDRESTLAAVKDYLEGRRADYEVEFRLRHKDGSWRWILTRANLNRDATGEPVRLIGCHIEITEREQAEEMVRSSEQRLRNVIDGLGPEMFVGLMTPDGTLIEANKPALAAAGLAPADVLGKPFEQTYWWSYSEPVQQQLREAIERAAHGESSRYDVQVRVAENQFIVVDFSLQPLRDETGKVAFLVPSANVITERKRAEAALRESEERYRTLFEMAPDGIAVFDPQMKIMMANRRAVEIYGYENSAELIGLSAYDLIAPQNRPRARENARRVIETGQMPPIESIGVKKDGTQFAVESSAALVRNPEGKLIAILGVSRDITERRLADEQLKASHEQLRALSARLQAVREEEGTRIAREIHDELGGALTGLKWDLEGIDKVLSGAGNGAKVQTIREKLPNMTGLIASTIDTVRRISAELRPSVLDDLGLVAAIEWQAQQFQTRTGIQCKYVGDTEALDLNCERATAVFRILQEILTNVIRHSQATRVDIELTEHRGYLELRVKDNGRGITEDEKRNTRSLGLLGMRERALLVDGEVSVSGAAGVGTTVVARVPLG